MGLVAVVMALLNSIDCRSSKNVAVVLCVAAMIQIIRSTDKFAREVWRTERNRRYSSVKADFAPKV
jgi:hypothetical protein